MTTTPAILITGCSSGIGLATALHLQQAGWRVAAAVRNPADVERLQRLGLQPVLLDLDDSTSIAQGVEQALQVLGGRIDALFNNAGFGQPGALEDISRNALRAQFETNVFGVLELTNQVIPWMRKQQRGHILINSSVLGYAALPYRGAYVASKFALEGIADTLRLELAGSGVQVVLIEPGPITSRFREHALAALARHVDIDASVHRERYRGVLARLTKPGPAAPFTLPAEAVARLVERVLSSPHPRPRYPITVPAIAFAWAKRLLTHRAMDRLLHKVAKNENRE